MVNTLFIYFIFKSKKNLKLFYKNQSLYLSFLAGCFTAVFALNMWYVLACISIIPLFIFLSKESGKANFINGLVFGIGIGLGLFFWMIKGIGYYTGNSFWYGILIFSLSCLLVGLYFGVLMWVTSFGSRNQSFN
jgi:apolipoprotein N-acyltransferase